MYKNEEDYLSNTTADPRLLGTGPILNPFAENISSQRGMMFSNHLAQMQVISGAEQPQLMSGFETKYGKYARNPTRRSTDVIVEAIIPKYNRCTGHEAIGKIPSYTIITRDADPHGKQVIDCFELSTYTMLAKGYGYSNKWNAPAIKALKPGQPLFKDTVLSTSPNVVGNQYHLGTNLRTAYMSLPAVTEDAFIISESAAKKLATETFDQVILEIKADQVPLNLYGKEGEYRFMPDIGETVGENGILCAIRTPSPASMAYDTMPQNLTQVQYLHDAIYYAPPGSRVVDVDVIVNRSLKNHFSDEVVSQALKYRNAQTEYYLQIYKVYVDFRKRGYPISPKFNQLVTTAIENLMAERNKEVQAEFGSCPDLTLVRKKQNVEYLYVKITYRHLNEIKRGYKLTGRCGNKGVVASIVPDEYMPVDDFGQTAQIIVDPLSVFNRMNPSQWNEQAILRASEFVRRDISKLVNEGRPDEAYKLLHSFLTDVNPKWAELIDRTHPTPIDRAALLNECINDAIYLQRSPFQTNWTHDTIPNIWKKYGVTKTPVTFYTKDENGEWRKHRSKQAVTIGNEYWYLLCKMPHMRCSGVGYTNQYRIPSKPDKSMRGRMPFAVTAVRFGEDEFRQLTMIVGPELAARIAAVYGLSPVATDQLIQHLLYDKHPGKLKQLEISTAEAVDTNTIRSVLEHSFAAVGINIRSDLDKMPPELRAKFLDPSALEAAHAPKARRPRRKTTTQADEKES